MRRNPHEFIKTEIVEHEGRRISTVELWDVYQEWCAWNEFTQVDCRSLGRAIAKRFPRVIRRRLGTRKARVWFYENIDWRIERCE